MNNLEDDGDKVLDFENFSVSSHSEKVDHNTSKIYLKSLGRDKHVIDNWNYQNITLTWYIFADSDGQMQERRVDQVQRGQKSKLCLMAILMLH